MGFWIWEFRLRSPPESIRSRSISSADAWRCERKQYQHGGGEHGGGAVREGEDVSVVGHRELPGSEGLRHSRHRAEYKFGSCEDELLRPRLHLRLRRHQSHPRVCTTRAIQHRHRPQPRPGRYFHEALFIFFNKYLIFVDHPEKIFNFCVVDF